MIFLFFDIALLNDKNKFLETRYPSILFYTKLKINAL